MAIIQQESQLPHSLDTLDVAAVTQAEARTVLRTAAHKLYKKLHNIRAAREEIGILRREWQHAEAYFTSLLNVIIGEVVPVDSSSWKAYGQASLTMVNLNRWSRIRDRLRASTLNFI